MRGAIAVVAGVVLACAAVALATSGEEGRQGPAERFLERYVDDDGRVVRRDQGGDTVSEGQAYALLLAVAAGDEDRFARVWDWTSRHLRRPDGLLAWHWADGRVADPEPAADADLDAARALLAAGRRFDEPRYAEAGRALGRAIGRHETTVEAGKTVLAAGPWAREEAVVNPSYWSPRAYAALGLRDVAAASRRLLLRLGERGLPPDWARVEPWGIDPAFSADGAAPAYSFDAVRVPIRLAESCHPADRAAAARMWPLLQTEPGASKRALDGRPLAGDEHPAMLAGAAAAAFAAGARRSADRLLARAERLDAERPTYYGAALIALTRTTLYTDALGGC
jgi:endoglucanase